MLASFLRKLSPGDLTDTLPVDKWNLPRKPVFVVLSEREGSARATGNAHMTNKVTPIAQLSTLWS